MVIRVAGGHLNTEPVHYSQTAIDTYQTARCHNQGQVKLEPYTDLALFSIQEKMSVLHAEGLGFRTLQCIRNSVMCVCVRERERERNGARQPSPDPDGQSALALSRPEQQCVCGDLRRV
jgi:hypothetical protein